MIVFIASLLAWQCEENIYLACYVPEDEVNEEEVLGELEVGILYYYNISEYF